MSVAGAMLLGITVVGQALDGWSDERLFDDRRSPP